MTWVAASRRARSGQADGVAGHTVGPAHDPTSPFRKEDELPGQSQGTTVQSHRLQVRAALPEDGEDSGRNSFDG